MDDADPVEAKATDDAAPAVKEDPPAADGEADDKTKAGGDEPHLHQIGTVPGSLDHFLETVRSCLRIVVPSDKAGYVIGPRGKIVAHMRKLSGCGFHLQETSKTHAIYVHRGGHVRRQAIRTRILPGRSRRRDGLPAIHGGDDPERRRP